MAAESWTAPAATAFLQISYLGPFLRGGAITDVAMESAGVTLVKGDLAGIARARALSRATMRNIRQNLVLAFVWNSIGSGRALPNFWAVAQPNRCSCRNEL